MNINQVEGFSPVIKKRGRGREGKGKKLRGMHDRSRNSGMDLN